MRPEASVSDSHETVRYAATSPADFALPGNSVLAFRFTYAQAIKLSVAIHSCLLRLNEYDRYKGGKDMGMSLSFKLDAKSLTVIDVHVAKDSDA
jgi:hypothetical protein